MLAINVDASPIGLIIAFLGGVVSILSPCVLPVLPGLVSIVSGATIGELENEKKLGSKVLKICLFFTLGFSSVYIVIGMATTSLSEMFLRNSSTMTRFGGALILIFAFIMLMNHLGWIKLFAKDSRPFLSNAVKDSGAFVTGAAFGFGWSPCFGPIMGAVIAYASTDHNIFSRISIIAAYCIGLCFSMTLIVYSSFRYKRFVLFLKKHLNVFVWTSVLLMIFFGVILLMNKMTWLTSYVTQFLDFIGLDKLITIG